MKTKSQTDQILSHLKRGWKLTALDALKRYGCFRLAARINELRAAGWPIITQDVMQDGKKFAAYKMAR